MVEDAKTRKYPVFQARIPAQEFVGTSKKVSSLLLLKVEDAASARSTTKTPRKSDVLACLYTFISV
jgi:hypothetical protein